MARIYVEFAGLKEIGQKCKEISSRLDTLNSDFYHTVNSLEWDIRFQSGINLKAGQAAVKMQDYSKILNDYQQFIIGACEAYEKLDSYSNETDQIEAASEQTGESNPSFWETVIKNYGTIDGINDTIGILGSIGKVSGYASKASNPVSRFFNNLTNKTSPYNLNKVWDPLTGAEGTAKAALSWTGVALTGIGDLFSNLDEQKQSDGTMSNERMVEETVVETAVDVGAQYATGAVVGAAIAAVTGTVAAPVVVAVAAGAAVATVNAGVEMMTGKSATEWVSDAVVDTAEFIGEGISNGAQAAGKWFMELQFTW